MSISPTGVVVLADQRVRTLLFAIPKSHHTELLRNSRDLLWGNRRITHEPIAVNEGLGSLVPDLWLPRSFDRPTPQMYSGSISTYYLANYCNSSVTIWK